MAKKPVHRAQRPPGKGAKTGNAAPSNPLDRAYRPERYIFEAYLKLPQPARVAVFFLVLLFVGYVIVKPTVLNGEFVIVQANNEKYIPFDAAEVQTVIDGRSVFVQPTRDGLWGIPITNSFEDIDVRFVAGNRARQRFTIPASDIWSVNLLTISYDPDNGNSPFKVHEKKRVWYSRWVHRWFSATRDLMRPGAAYAQQATPAQKPEAATYRELVKLVSTHFGVRGESAIKPYMTIRGVAETKNKEKKSTVVELLNVRAKVERQFGVVLDGKDAQFIFDIPIEKAAAYINLLSAEKRGK